jgi:hypothetical protein
MENCMRLSWILITGLACISASSFAVPITDTAAAVKKSGVTKISAGSATVSNEKKEIAKTPVANAAVKPTTKSEPLPDTLVMTARLIEIPGKFAPNDLYNYVYIMKYRVVKVIKGKYTGQEILVGHYNPLIPRKQIQDKMTRYVAGDVVKFQAGDIHTLVLIKPIERVWKDAVEDEYFDSDLEKYFALRADAAK